MTDFVRNLDQFRTTIMSIQNHSNDSAKLRFISPDKWKKLMLKSLQLVSEFNYADSDLIHDLRFVINNISQDKFVQTILSFQPFKPKFRDAKFLNLDRSSKILQSTTTNSQSYFQTPKTRLKKDSSIIQKGSVIIKKKSMKKQPKTCQTLRSLQVLQKSSFLKQYLEVIIQEETLKKQFEKKYHPFKKIIDSFVFILENKYKNLIDSSINKIQLLKIQQLITYDVLILQKLMVKISQPYLTIYQSENPQEVKCFKNKMQNFMKEYIHDNEKINLSIRKVMRHYARKSKLVEVVQKSIDDFVEISKFNIPEDFKIDGCYVQSMNSLMQFAQTLRADQALKKLKQFRAAIAKDVDQYYQSAGQLKQRQINAQVQIQIIRFVFCKLKGWIPEIFAQLKYLQVVYGDEEIAYKYDDASYIYAQLITVFDALQIQSSHYGSMKESLINNG